MRKQLIMVSGLALSAMLGCLGQAPTGQQNQPTTGNVGNSDTSASGNNTAAGPSGTFDHPTDQVDPFDVLERIQKEGPPEVATRLHSCQKVKFATVGNLLMQLGVDLAKTSSSGPATAGELYSGGPSALGAPNYGARVPESIEITAAGATKLYDIFVQAAPEIVQAMPMNDHCKVAGAATSMFDAGGKCTLDGISCLTGAPATQAQKDLCDASIDAASTMQIGQNIAVASILAAAHTCE